MSSKKNRLLIDITYKNICQISQTLHADYRSDSTHCTVHSAVNVNGMHTIYHKCVHVFFVFPALLSQIRFRHNLRLFLKVGGLHCSLTLCLTLRLTFKDDILDLQRIV